MLLVLIALTPAVSEMAFKRWNEDILRAHCLNRRYGGDLSLLNLKKPRVVVQKESISRRTGVAGEYFCATGLFNQVISSDNGLAEKKLGAETRARWIRYLHAESEPLDP